MAKEKIISVFDKGADKVPIEELKKEMIDKFIEEGKRVKVTVTFESENDIPLKFRWYYLRTKNIHKIWKHLNKVCGSMNNPLVSVNTSKYVRGKGTKSFSICFEKEQYEEYE